MSEIFLFGETKPHGHEKRTADGQTVRQMVAAMLSPHGQVLSNSKTPAQIMNQNVPQTNTLSEENQEAEQLDKPPNTSSASFTMELRKRDRPLCWEEEVVQPATRKEPSTMTQTVMIPMPTRHPEKRRVTRSQVREEVFKVASFKETVCINKISEDWEARHEVFRSLTQGHQHQQTTYVLLWGLPPEKRISVFKLLQAWARWDPGSAETTWALFISTGKALKLSPSPEDHQFLQNLRSQHKAAPVKVPIILTPEETEDIIQQLVELGEVGPAIALSTAYSTIQRLSDLARVRTADVHQIGEFIAIQITEGKVTKRIGAFTIHVLRDSTIGAAIWSWTLKRRKEHQDYLFDVQETKDAVKACLPKGKSILAIRKGAAWTAAVNGRSIPQLQECMRHKSETTTEIYLGKGIANLVRAQSIAETTQAIGLNPSSLSYGASNTTYTSTPAQTPAVGHSTSKKSRFEKLC